MKISTKGRYGIRFLIDIAEQGSGAQVKLSEISKRQGISATYLGQISTALKRAGYIRSLKGSNGGFVLAKSLSEIRIDQVLEALEGDLKVVESPLPTDFETSYKKALRLGLYEKIDKAVSETLKAITLDKLLSKELREAYMYYI